MRAISCEYCGARYVTKEPEHIHQCVDGGEAMRKAWLERPLVVMLRPGQTLTVKACD